MPQLPAGTVAESAPVRAEETTRVRGSVSARARGPRDALSGLSTGARVLGGSRPSALAVAGPSSQFSAVPTVGPGSRPNVDTSQGALPDPKGKRGRVTLHVLVLPPGTHRPGACPCPGRTVPPHPGRRLSVSVVAITAGLESRVTVPGRRGCGDWYQDLRVGTGCRGGRVGSGHQWNKRLNKYSF